VVTDKSSPVVEIDSEAISLSQTRDVEVGSGGKAQPSTVAFFVGLLAISPWNTDDVSGS
jgi:hypothetical protein